MAWTIEFDKKARKEFESLDRSVQKKFDRFLLTLMKSSNPRIQGSALHGRLNHCWRYRIGDYRLICAIEDKKLTVLILSIKHRKDVYR